MEDTNDTIPPAGHFSRMVSAISARMPFGSTAETAEEDAVEIALNDPDIAVQPELPDTSNMQPRDVVVYMYCASVCWLAYNHIQRAVESLSENDFFEGRNFHTVNMNWPMRSSYKLAQRLDPSHPEPDPPVSSHITESNHFLAKPFRKSKFLPVINEGGPRHLAIIAIGGNDILQRVKSVQDDTVSAEQFGDELIANTRTIINTLQTTGFERVAVIPLKAENLQATIESLTIPEDMITQLDRVYQTIAADYPDFVFVSDVDLYHGLNSETDFLDSPTQDYSFEYAGEKQIYNHLRKADANPKETPPRRFIHPNPNGQKKVAQTIKHAVVNLVTMGVSQQLQDTPAPQTTVQDAAVVEPRRRASVWPAATGLATRGV